MISDKNSKKALNANDGDVLADEEKKEGHDHGANGVVNTNMNLKEVGSISSRRAKDNYLDATDDINDKDIIRSKKGNQNVKDSR